MAVDPKILINVVYSDFKQPDVLLPDGTIVPINFIDEDLNIIADDEVYNDNPQMRGVIRTTGVLEDVTDEQALLFETKGTVPTSSADDAAETIKKQVRAIETHRDVTVLCDRTLEHIVDYLETYQAANNIVKTKDKIKETLSQIDVLSDDIQSISSSITSISSSFTSFLSTLATALGTIIGGQAAAAAVLAFVPSFPLSNIQSSTAKLNSDVIAIKAKLLTIGTELDTILYNNSIKVM